MNTLFMLLCLVSMVAVPVCLILWLVKLATKKPAKKMLKRALISAVCCVMFFVLFGLTTEKCEHEYTLVESEAATCEKDGYEKYHCDLCGRDKTEKVDKLGHDMVDDHRTESTEDADGEYIRKCSRCGYEEIEVLKKLEKPTEATKPTEAEKPTENTEENYKNSCIEVDYKDLCRYPDNYKGKTLKIVIQVKQIMNDDLFGISKAWRAQTDNDGLGWYIDDEYYLVDKRASGSIKVLEDDVLVVYGEFTGMKTVTRALTWTRDEIPQINVKYTELVEWQTCEEIYAEYAQKMRDAVPTLIDEFYKEAETNTDGITGLAEISNSKVSALAEIETNGTQKMSATYSNAGETYDDYTEWAGKLWDVYMEEAGKIQDAYMEYATN